MPAASPNSRHTATFCSAQIRQSRTSYIRNTLGDILEKFSSGTSYSCFLDIKALAFQEEGVKEGDGILKFILLKFIQANCIKSSPPPPLVTPSPLSAHP